MNIIRFIVDYLVVHNIKPVLGNGNAGGAGYTAAKVVKQFVNLSGLGSLLPKGLAGVPMGQALGGALGPPGQAPALGGLMSNQPHPPKKGGLMTNKAPSSSWAQNPPEGTYYFKINYNRGTLYKSVIIMFKKDGTEMTIKGQRMPKVVLDVNNPTRISMQQSIQPVFGQAAQAVNFNTPSSEHRLTLRQIENWHSDDIHFMLLGINRKPCRICSRGDGR